MDYLDQEIQQLGQLCSQAYRSYIHSLNIANLSIVLFLILVTFLGFGVHQEKLRILICRYNYVFWAAYHAKWATVGSQLCLSNWAVV